MTTIRTATPDRPPRKPLADLVDVPGTNGKVMVRPTKDCAVCMSPLVQWNGVYHHPGPSDHLPDPVDVPELDEYKRQRP